MKVGSTRNALRKKQDQTSISIAIATHTHTHTFPSIHRRNMQSHDTKKVFSPGRVRLAGNLAAATITRICRAVAFAKPGGEADATASCLATLWGNGYQCSTSTKWCTGYWASDMLHCCPCSCDPSSCDPTSAECEESLLPTNDDNCLQAKWG